MEISLGTSAMLGSKADLWQFEVSSGFAALWCLLD